MKSAWTILIAVLVVGGPHPGSAAEDSAADLLEKGIFEEETAGRLDQAIKIYAEIVKKHRQDRRYAAEALFRLGRCYERKKMASEASKAFESLLRDFPGQNELVRRATQRLEKLGRPASPFATDQHPTFATTIVDNAGLDLDTGRLVRGARLDPQSLPGFELSWDNDAGGVLTKVPGGSVRLLALTKASSFAAAGRQALERFGELERSIERGLPAKQCRFFAILTDARNLGVVEVRQFDRTQARVNWSLARVWVLTDGTVRASAFSSLLVPEFGPAVTCTVNDDSAMVRMAIDLDTGEVLSVPQRVKDTKSEQAINRWFEESGADVFGELGDRVRGFGHVMIAVPVPNEDWRRSAAEVADMVRTGESTRILSGKERVPATFAFQTRQGAIGILQIVGFQESPPAVKVRFKRVQLGERDVRVPSLDARQTVEKWMELALGGKDTSQLGVPGRALHENQFRKMPGVEKIQVAVAEGNARAALVVTTEVLDDRGRGGVLVFRVINKGGGWRIDDVDLESPANAKGQLEGFSANPGSRRIAPQTGAQEE